MNFKVFRFINLFLAGLLTGNEFGGFVGFHPALHELSTEAHARAEKAITRRLGRIMPTFMTATIASFVPVVLRSPGRGSFFSLMGMLCYGSMLGVTFLGNMPVNRRMLEMDPDTVSGEELKELRRRWERFHAVRNLLNFAGFTFALSAALFSKDT